MLHNPISFVTCLAALSLVGAGCGLLPGRDFRGLQLNGLEFLDASSSTQETSGERPLKDHAALVVAMIAEKDLRAFAARYSYNVWNEVSFCQDGEFDPSRPLQDNPYIFDASGEAIEYGDGTREPESAGSGPFLYRVHISVKSFPLAGQDVFEYDLRKRESDVCVRLGGGNMLGGSFLSDVVVVPAADIEAALSGAS